jgi:hypothetical protein
LVGLVLRLAAGSWCGAGLGWFAVGRAGGMGGLVLVFVPGGG